MGGKNYIPSNDAAFNTWFKNLCQYVASKASGANPVWTHIPAAAQTALNNTYAAWYTAYAVTLLPCTKPQRDEKTRVRKTSEKAVRDFVNAYLRFYPTVTDDDREQMGLHIPDTTPTAIPTPTAQVEADVAYPGVHLIELNHIRAVSGGDDPRSDYGVRIFWGVIGPVAAHDKFRLAGPPVTGDDLPHSTFTHRKRYLFDFSGDSGNTVWFSLRFENEKGGKEGEGPFGPLFSAIIP
jgi:hypothetical protein